MREVGATRLFGRSLMRPSRRTRPPPQLALGRGCSSRACAAALLLLAGLPAPSLSPWLLPLPPRRPIPTLPAPTAPLQQGQPVVPRDEPAQRSEWFRLEGSLASFGTKAELHVPLAGSAEQARAWFLGEPGERSGSVGRLLEATRPVGAEVQEGSGGAAAEELQQYTLRLPAVSLLGMGSAEASMGVWGAVHEAGGPQRGGGAYMEIGSVGGPEVSLRLPGSRRQRHASLSLDMRGALGVEEAPGGSARLVGWISLEVHGQVPSLLGGIGLPEAILRPAAREVLSRTMKIAMQRLRDDLARDFAASLR